MSTANIGSKSFRRFMNALIFTQTRTLDDFHNSGLYCFESDLDKTTNRRT